LAENFLPKDEKKMEEKNLDWKAISVSSGHRSPYMNNKVKGAATVVKHEVVWYTWGYSQNMFENPPLSTST
jgi:hypothetical protein